MKCQRVAFILFVLSLSWAPARPAASQALSDADLAKTAAAISRTEIVGYVTELTSPAYDGRLSGTPGYMKSAQWVADQLKAWGIRPAGDNGTYFQRFDNPYTVVKQIGSVRLEPAGGAAGKTYEFPKDFYPGSNSASGTVTGEVVYVGHGITAPDLAYDDYAGVDVRGKIVLMDSGLPYDRQDEGFAKWVPYDYHQYKQENAKKHGAIGMLYIGLTANPNTLYQPGFVYAHVSPAVAEAFFTGTGVTYKEHKESLKALRPAPLATGKRATITATTERHAEGTSCNVIGLIEGTDPVLKNEVIIVGGHLDHVGNLGVVFPGALDNASGVADILAAAKALASLPVKPKRSIVVLFIGGEEGGLLGSTFYTRSPKFPKDKTVAFFNIDMAGNGTGLSVGGGQTYPLIYRHFEAANAQYVKRPIRTSAVRQGTGRPRSDGVIFQRAGFRTLSFGASGQTSVRTYYHEPEDTTATLTPDVMEDLVKVMVLGLTSMANAADLVEPVS